MLSLMQPAQLSDMLLCNLDSQEILRLASLADTWRPALHPWMTSLKGKNYVSCTMSHLCTLRYTTCVLSMHVSWSACGRKIYNLLQVGQVFHPEQDRIVSVRECARAQVRCQVKPVILLMLKHGGDRSAGV